MNDDPRRILVVDDTPSIHEDFSRIFLPEPVTCDDAPVAAEAMLFQEQAAPPASPVGLDWHLEHAFQGTEAIEPAQRAMVRGDFFDVAFVDM